MYYKARTRLNLWISEGYYVALEVWRGNDISLAGSGENRSRRSWVGGVGIKRAEKG